MKGKYISTINTKHRINNQIVAGELRVVDAEGKSLGVIPKENALKMAQDQGLDLIEIAPQAKPPVAKIISYDKFRYQLEKELKKQHGHKSGGELKGIRISARAAENDLRIKATQAMEFIEKGHKVEIMLVLRGREKYNREWAKERMANFIKMITKEYKVTSPEKFGGRGIIMQIVKK